VLTERLDLLRTVPVGPSKKPPPSAAAWLKSPLPPEAAAAVGDCDLPVPFRADTRLANMSVPLVGLVLLRGLSRLASQLEPVRVWLTQERQFCRKLSRLLAKLLLTPPAPPKAPRGGAHMSCAIGRGLFCRWKVSAE
jgi:hypothetical protein